MGTRDYLKGAIKALAPDIRTKGKTVSWLRGCYDTITGGIGKFGGCLKSKFCGGRSIFSGLRGFNGPRMGHRHGIPHFGHRPFISLFDNCQFRPNFGPYPNILQHGCGHKFDSFMC